MKKYVIKRDENSLPERLTRYRNELNAEQFRVVTAPPKASLVVAGAGTGKTRTITYRVAYLIEQGVSPHQLEQCLGTFSRLKPLTARQVVDFQRKRAVGA